MACSPSGASVDGAPRCGWRPVGKTTGDHVMTGPRGLLAAVLLRALDDVREGNGHAADAAWWIQSDRADGPCTFRMLCESLDLAASRVRAAAGGGGGFYSLPPAPEKCCGELAALVENLPCVATAKSAMEREGSSA